MGEKSYLCSKYFDRKSQKYKIKNLQKIYTSPESWVNSFKNNKNTGVREEITTGLNILICSNLTTLDKVREIEEYKDFEHNDKFNVENLKGIINLTQSDNLSGTADIKLLFKSGKTKSFSVTQYHKHITKCIINPSPKKLYNLDNNLEVINNKNIEAFNKALLYRKNSFGETPNKKWKRLTGKKKCIATQDMNTFTAKTASDEWNNLSEEDRVNKLKFILDLNKKGTNCDGIIYTKKNSSIEKIYSWKLKIKLSEYIYSTSYGIYIYHHCKIPDNVEKEKWVKENHILKVQCKYNNGIIEGISSSVPEEKWEPRKGDPISSWNINAQLEKIFDMNDITNL